MIKALIFDCFGVFYTDPVFAYMRDPATSPQNARAMHDLDEQAARGLITRPEFVKQAAILIHGPAATAERQFFQGLERNEPLVAFAEAARSNYQVALLSNIGGDMMDGFFAPAERRRLFDDVILSGDVKLAKPDPRIFQLACDRLGVLPAEAVMIDDVQGNVDAAVRLGMAGIHYQTFGQFEADITKLLK